MATEATLTTTDDDLPILNGAQQPFVEQYGTAVTWNTYHKILTVLLVVGLLLSQVNTYRIQTQYAHLKPLVIRIHEDGRANLSTYDEATTYTPQVYELRYFLRHFVEEFYSRSRASLERDYTHALYFLGEAYQQTLASSQAVQQVRDTFRRTPSADDVEVKVDNVVLSELKAPPYHAAVYFTRQAYQQGTRTKRGAAQQFDLQIDFAIAADPPAWMRDVNPLGLEITRLSEPFGEFK